ncbi:membrane protein insertase YidC [Candidatus Peregrinibacteria bacterium]|nr:membrane protein insertase YidC [Candidatus Peregrinibacteria bacterium]
MKKQKIITWILFFLILLLVMQLFSKKRTPAPELTASSLGVEMAKNEFAQGEEVKIKIKNNTQNPLTIKSNCPKNPLAVYFYTGEKFEKRSVEAKLNCETVPDITIQPDSENSISYKYWNYSLFNSAGRYKIEIEAADKDGKKLSASSPEFTVAEAGFWRKLFRTAFYQPLYNILVFFVKIAPMRDLGFAIILLTILIRLILLIPSQRAIVSQRRMQELQPKLNKLKKEFAGNQERIAAETMKLWKENKVNPFGSCLPLLVQFPVLIALFYVIQNGLNPDNIYLLYKPLKSVDLSNVHTNFLGILELTKINKYILPLIVGALQFFQLKLASSFKKNKSEEKEAAPSEMETANKTMTYIMPVMIAIFTASVPAGVGLYWGVSTLFALGQQVIANRKQTLGGLKPKT